MTQPAPARTGPFLYANRILLVIGAFCFVIAALSAGGVFTGQSLWAWGFGGFAAWCLAGAV
jgi:hypothetical protein